MIIIVIDAIIILKKCCLWPYLFGMNFVWAEIQNLISNEFISKFKSLTFFSLKIHVELDLINDVGFILRWWKITHDKIGNQDEVTSEAILKVSLVWEILCNIQRKNIKSIHLLWQLCVIFTYWMNYRTWIYIPP